MDAIEFIKEKKRMCKSYSSCTDTCLIRKSMDESRSTCIGYCFEYPEKAVAIVERWSAEHPAKTRQSEFLKMFPNAKVGNSNAIEICPKIIDTTLGRYCDSEKKCCDCLKEYWLAEVD